MVYRKSSIYISHQEMSGGCRDILWYYADDLSQSRRLPFLQVVSNNKSISVGVQSLTEINAPRGCAVILKRICQLTLTRITRQVSRAFDLKFLEN